MTSNKYKVFNPYGHGCNKGNRIGQMNRSYCVNCCSDCVYDKKIKKKTCSRGLWK